MEGLPELRKMRASSLSPELYGEISEFLFSVHPDFAISGKTSLHIIYDYLQKARKKKISAKKMRRAEEMIRALCAAAENLRELRAKALAGAEKGEKKCGSWGKKPEQLALAPRISGEIEAKFGQLGITDRKAMERVLAFIGEEEFSARHAKAIGSLPERAYRPFFSRIPDFLTTPKFYEAVDLLAQKVRIIDRLAEARQGVPHGLDYTRDASVLLFTMQQIAAVGRLDRLIAGIRPEGMPIAEARRYAGRLTDPEEMRKLLEKIGFSARESWDGSSYICVRKGESGAIAGIALIDRKAGVRYSIAMVSTLLMQAGVGSDDLRKAGLFA